MYGKGILSGLSVTLKHFFDTYIDDIKWLGRRYFNPEGIAHRSSKDATGVFTVQYPEEKLPVPEEFRYVPFLVYDEKERRREGDPLHVVRYLRQGLPAAMHLDRPNE